MAEWDADSAVLREKLKAVMAAARTNTTGQAAGAAMSGQVLAMVPVFREMFLSYPTDGSGSSPS